MSRSDVKAVNPAKKFLKWDTKAGEFQFYDKESKVNVQIPLPVKFLVLDTLSTIKGFSDSAQSGFYSNEVRDTTKQILSVYIKSGMVAKGLYADLKTNTKCTGIKYCQSVYIGLVGGDNMSLCNIQMTGAALSAWIDFSKTTNPEKGAIEVSAFTQGSKGATKFKIPTFTKIEASDVENEEALKINEELQDYLTLYFE